MENIAALREGVAHDPFDPIRKGRPVSIWANVAGLGASGIL
jgi:hypothetical protein